MAFGVNSRLAVASGTQGKRLWGKPRHSRAVTEIGLFLGRCRDRRGRRGRLGGGLDCAPSEVTTAPVAVSRNASTLRTGACHGPRGAPSPPCSLNPDVDMAPLSVTFGPLLLLLMGEPTSQLSIRFLSTFRYICPVPHERRGEFREQPGGADEPKHHAEAAWPADQALFRVASWSRVCWGEKRDIGP
jgi:hypothetical protein